MRWADGHSAHETKGDSDEEEDEGKAAERSEREGKRDCEESKCTGEGWVKGRKVYDERVKGMI
jgi:hypothetical protein